MQSQFAGRRIDYDDIARIEFRIFYLAIVNGRNVKSRGRTLAVNTPKHDDLARRYAHIDAFSHCKNLNQRCMALKRVHSWVLYRAVDGHALTVVFPYENTDLRRLDIFCPKSLRQLTLKFVSRFSPCWQFANQRKVNEPILANLNWFR